MDESVIIARKTAKELVAGHKGLLAMDEGASTINERFARLEISQTPETHRDYREMLITTPGLNQYINGVILDEETIRQQTSKKKSFISVLQKAGMIAGIKADMGLARFSGYPGEKITEGLDGLPERLKEYAGMGLKFAKWRAVFSIASDKPSEECIQENLDYMARYALYCHQAGLMPIVEPEVLMDGDHNLQQCSETTKKVLLDLFEALNNYKVDLHGILLKPNMVLPGSEAKETSSLAEIAGATLDCFKKCVPHSVAGIAFLSGGQSSEIATSRLNEMHKPQAGKLPWPVTFSFSRALQYPAMEVWKGLNKNIAAAQKALLIRARCNWQAGQGIYHPLQSPAATN